MWSRTKKYPQYSYLQKADMGFLAYDWEGTRIAYILQVDMDFPSFRMAVPNKVGAASVLIGSTHCETISYTRLAT